MKKSTKKRILRYDLAINEALTQCMKKDKSVLVLGQGVKSPWYVGNTTKGLYDRFGEARVIDTPVSENAMTGVATGAALSGLRPIIIHPRMDFMIYAMEQTVNEAANWHYMFGGVASVPMVIRPIINRKGEQAAQHSQALHAWFSHIPGLKVVMPTTAYDAKGLMIAAIQDNNPVVYIDDRLLYDQEDPVPTKEYTVPIGKARVARKGKDVTIVAISSMVPEALKAAETLKKNRIDVEVIDLRSLKPIDEKTILQSVRKTGRLVVADSGWLTYGASAEIAAIVCEKGFKNLKAPIARIALPDCPAPASAPLEKAYYHDYKDIIQAVKKVT